ncbi:MAG TPA: GIY-YIG nuclease family protein [Chryseolinea sp.]|nr:GIY-YIG nuclease family protein [Chryseolinea sp.]
MFTFFILPSSGRVTSVRLLIWKQGRLSHNVGLKGWTVRGRPWVLIYFETFSSKVEAIKREKELKSGNGKAFLRNVVLPNYFQSL